MKGQRETTTAKTSRKRKTQNTRQTRSILNHSRYLLTWSLNYKIKHRHDQTVVVSRLPVVAYNNTMILSNGPSGALNVRF